MRPLHLFLHIPKTAGVTVTAVAARQYPPGSFFQVYDSPGHRIEDLMAAPRAHLDSLRLVTGHFPYGMHRYFDGRPCRYITMLRDPMDGVPSTYFYIRRCATHPLHDALLANNITLPQWIARQWYGHIDSTQVRFLTGRVDLSPLSRSDLERAKEVLVEKIDAFGLVDRFDESLLLFADALDWRRLDYVSRNVYRAPEDEAAVTDEVRSLIAEHHTMGGELVAFARQIFEARVQARGAGFAHRLEALRRANQEGKAP